jgi:hypothetical protein
MPRKIRIGEFTPHAKFATTWKRSTQRRFRSRAACCGQDILGQATLSRPILRVPPRKDRLVDEGTRAMLRASGGSAARSNLEQARIYFKRALEVMPTHARSSASTAGCTHHGNVRDDFRPGSGDQGPRAVMAALAADDRSTTTHSAIAQISADDDFSAASRRIALSR